jgi:hypothetical protein
MKVRQVLFAVVSAVTVAATANSVMAWEAQTTHVGLAEQAGLASVLHKRLVDAGWTGGLFELLSVPPADAPELIAVLARMSPTHGTTPDARGRQTALSWLAAGAALADNPAAFAANHYFDPVLAKAGKDAGYDRRTTGVVGNISGVFDKQLGLRQMPSHGVSALQWIVSKDNPFNIDAFYDHYVKSVTSASSGERARHLAAALVALGATLHVLGDMGSPAHVRNDATVEFLGADNNDYGSRFDRIAALSFGRLGVPAPSSVVTRTSVRAFFTSADNKGLADQTAIGYFSAGTLPKSTAIVDGMTRSASLQRPSPALPNRLNLMAASNENGTMLRSSAGVCLARYRVNQGQVNFFTDDDCQLEQVAALLPVTASYETGLTDFMLRGQLRLTRDGSDVVVATTQAMTSGTVTLVSQDARGNRTVVATKAVAAVAADAEIGRFPVTSSTAWFAVAAGVDGNAEKIVAIGGLLSAAVLPVPPAAAAVPAGL